MLKVFIHQKCVHQVFFLCTHQVCRCRKWRNCVPGTGASCTKVQWWSCNVWLCTLCVALCSAYTFNVCGSVLCVYLQCVTLPRENSSPGCQSSLCSPRSTKFSVLFNQQIVLLWNFCLCLMAVGLSRTVEYRLFLRLL